MANCVHCMTRGSQEVRYDVKQRPYLVCMACGCRTFFRSKMAFRGATLIDRLVSLVPDDRELQRQIDSGLVDPYLAKLAAIVSGANTPAPAPAPVKAGAAA